MHLLRFLYACSLFFTVIWTSIAKRQFDLPRHARKVVLMALWGNVFARRFNKPSIYFRLHNNSWLLIIWSQSVRNSGQKKTINLKNEISKKFEQEKKEKERKISLLLSSRTWLQRCNLNKFSHPYTCTHVDAEAAITARTCETTEFSVGDISHANKSELSYPDVAVVARVRGSDLKFS